jgi:hypothetical protein
MSIGKSATQLERKITEWRRGSVSHITIYRVIVLPQRWVGSGGWTTVRHAKMGMTISQESDCELDAIERDLRRKYHLEPGY